MPSLGIEKAGCRLVSKRPIGSGYVGIDGGLLHRRNTLMVFGDTDEMCEETVEALD